MPWQPPQGIPALLQQQPSSFGLGQPQGGVTSIPPGFLQYLMAQHYAYQQPAYQYQPPATNGGLAALQQYRMPQLGSLTPPATAINAVTQPAQSALPTPDYNSFNWAG